MNFGEVREEDSKQVTAVNEKDIRKTCCSFPNVINAPEHLVADCVTNMVIR
jgi:hypothetical protein